MAMPHRIAPVLVGRMKTDPDMEAFYVGTDLGVTQERPGT